LIEDALLSIFGRHARAGLTMENYLGLAFLYSSV